MTDTTEVLKRQATRLKKETGISHHEALDRVVKEKGFQNWAHYLNANSIPPKLTRKERNVNLSK